MQQLIDQEVHVGTPIEKCREINTSLLTAEDGDRGGYPNDIFEDLVYRYEEPNGMNRWDSPLFTVPYNDEAPPFDAIWEAIVGSGEVKTAKPNLATVSVWRLHSQKRGDAPLTFGAGSRNRI